MFGFSWPKQHYFITQQPLYHVTLPFATLPPFTTLPPSTTRCRAFGWITVSSSWTSAESLRPGGHLTEPWTLCRSLSTAESGPSTSDSSDHMTSRRLPSGCTAATSRYDAPEFVLIGVNIVQLYNGLLSKCIYVITTTSGFHRKGGGGGGGERTWDFPPQAKIPPLPLPPKSYMSVKLCILKLSMAIL